MKEQRQDFLGEAINALTTAQMRLGSEIYIERDTQRKARLGELVLNAVHLREEAVAIHQNKENGEVLQETDAEDAV